jgi:hypothetical protein
MTKTEHKHPLWIVSTVALMVFAVRFSSFIFPHTTRVDPHINLSEDRTRKITESQRQQQIAAFVSVTEGEVFRTEERIREASALATATSLFSASQSLNRRAPANVTDLVIGTRDAGLLPPGLELLGTDGSVTSPHSKLTVRYRPEPLGIEVVSVGKVALDGPALLVRVDGTNKEGATLYVASSLEQTMLPNAFAREAEIFALGFATEPIRTAKPPNP